MDSAIRHLFKYMSGVDDGEDHLISAAWNLMCAVDTESRVKESVLPQEILDIGPSQAPPATTKEAPSGQVG